MTANCSLLLPDRSLRPLVQRWLSDIPAGRLAEVTDLRAAVVYLASDAWEYMTEHNLVIQGTLELAEVTGHLPNQLALVPAQSNPAFSSVSVSCGREMNIDQTPY
ncbi:uncharacterized protein [Nerophis lumbriciformis]|uniref:uncharacterized protein isoform X2 n=1 Tax=Nerophis lumbriciformis TaxID=546530 RepID=UPI003BAB4C8A